MSAIDDIRWWSPEHAEAIETALELLLAEINSAVITGLPEMQWAAIIEHCVATLRNEITMEIEAELKFDSDLGLPEEPDEDDES